LFEISVCAVAGLDEAVAGVEDCHHQHAEREHVARGAALRLVLNLRSCKPKKIKKNSKFT
jgi:hypothetical protein